MLPVVVSENFLGHLFKLIAKDPGTIVRIDLGQQIISLPETGESESFEINQYKKECLMKGLDDIEYLLSIRDLITAYELRNTLK